MMFFIREAKRMPDSGKIKNEVYHNVASLNFIPPTQAWELSGLTGNSFIMYFLLLPFCLLQKHRKTLQSSVVLHIVEQWKGSPG